MHATRCERRSGEHGAVPAAPAGAGQGSSSSLTQQPGYPAGQGPPGARKASAQQPMEKHRAQHGLLSRRDEGSGRGPQGTAPPPSRPPATGCPTRPRPRAGLWPLPPPLPAPPAAEVPSPRPAGVRGAALCPRCSPGLGAAAPPRSLLLSRSPAPPSPPAPAARRGRCCGSACSPCTVSGGSGGGAVRAAAAAALSPRSPRTPAGP